MKKIKLTSSYLILALILIVFGLIFLRFSNFRIITSIIIGISYFLWGILVHKKEKMLYLPIILEYLAISLLATIILIFLSLRA